MHLLSGIYTLGLCILNDTFFDHFVQLIRLVHLCIQFEISREEVDEIRKGFADWVMKYEEYVTSFFDFFTRTN